MKKTVTDTLDRLGWAYQPEGDGILLSKYSPAGEDFGFHIDGQDIPQEVAEYAESFDADEHATMWAEARKTTRGVPQSLRELIDDADAIQQMLDELSNALGEEENNG